MLIKLKVLSSKCLSVRRRLLLPRILNSRSKVKNKINRKILNKVHNKQYKILKNKMK